MSKPKQMVKVKAYSVVARKKGSTDRYTLIIINAYNMKNAGTYFKHFYELDGKVRAYNGFADSTAVERSYPELFPDFREL